MEKELTAPPAWTFAGLEDLQNLLVETVNRLRSGRMSAPTATAYGKLFELLLKVHDRLAAGKDGPAPVINIPADLLPPAGSKCGYVTGHPAPGQKESNPR